ncbi:MAG TPA: hypothetical protein VE093_32100 [Polyangiaceae bacterium]|jgi:hypothetical protein|nr:hypothetical protein [Polyangiaceae bacterium]
MLKNRNSSIALLFTITAMASVGCQAGKDIESAGGVVEAPASENSAQQASAGDVDHVNAIIAELAVGERSTVRFVDESLSVPGGGVGVLILGAPHLSAGYKELGLTPLELYRAIAPEGDVPELLRGNHLATLQARGLAAAEPRRVSLEAGALALDGTMARAPGHESNAQSTSSTACSYSAGKDEPGYWADTWCFSTASGSDWCDTAFGLTGNIYAYTGAAAERWLAACNDSNISNATIGWVVQAQTGAGVWSHVSGTSTTVAKNVSVNYYSSGFSVQNYRASVTAGSTVVYQVGAARD